ncbi:MAG: DNAase [Piscirickettsiaceae bacterium CG_4_9_14_3_um_filter_43_564]|nr:TatD family hydrolase [Thiomicrospira sp.]OIP96803.1 MAG: DNAase [Thiomicrospira sp. CG2_30_44_34]PIQ04698.1 MAG: DNAase [Piscirickettsiaceae bacterium CG18_big_fil_WC_8_21_14_2_50_44_103]PIU39364.1 MAG: DNAase [Piscirickettsiaceae bacterium CG07_land_8_20_14_0_80_44_28]PIW77799.1 MAG: DNAase [Piscirickettsiaceae bacterium CG_4_8_14_3_um_filter_44_38]PIX79574.1 MAG: DNAase [Piscirickettsiaceae bacterium CG_4_10_14_3_um_filter_44_349]PIY77521.1 MAG: DNAase [Piscirickettsiaceae bacterium CG_
MIIDSHCHLNILPEPLGSTEQVIQTALENDVRQMMCIAIAPKQWQEVLDLATRYQGVYAAIGVHPCEPADVTVTDAELMATASHPKVLAIGEIGLDYYHFDIETEDMAWQQNRFRQMIRLAIQLNKPIIIHTRNSTEDCLRILREEGAQQVGGIMHCFVEDLATAEAAMALGFYISFSGIVTFKNAKEIKTVAAAVPLDRILVETDSPYLAPVPYRGKPNQPAYTRYVVEEIARLRGLSVEAVAQATTENFQRLFKL